MKPFMFVAALFVSPVVLNAYLFVVYELCCLAPTWQPARLFLPVLLAIFGYFIFILEGAQSSVILANKHSSETLNRILVTIDDISNKKRQWASKALSGIIAGAKIDNFIIGRQLLIIAFAFLFKLSYDSARLTPIEVQTISGGQIGCTIRPDWILTIYNVLDSSVFSTLLCSVLVAYFFQVPSKLMAQYHPMRFLTSIPLAIDAPMVSRWLGTLSQLGRPLDALRKRGELQISQDKFSYFSSRELSPVDTQQLFEALANYYGEYVRELTVELCPHSQDRDVWFVETNTIYKIVRPSRQFSQAIQVPQMSAFIYDVFAEDLPGQNRRLPLQTSDKRFNIIPPPGETPEVLARVYARFDSDQPKGALVIWKMSYLTPILMTPGMGGIPSKIFDIHIKKPVEKVVFRVAGMACEDPDVDILPVDGAEKPTYGWKEKERTNTTNGLVVHYPSIGSMLKFKF